MWHQIETNHVQQSEDAGLGNPHRSTDDSVGLLNGNSLVNCRDDGVLKPIGPNAVGDEPWRILALDHRLSQRRVGKILDGCDGVWPGLGPCDQLE